MKMHELKTWPVYFCAIKAGVKTFDVRFDDRGYQAGDVLHLREWDPRLAAGTIPDVPESSRDGYTGDDLVAVVTYLLPVAEVPRFRGLTADPWVVMGVKVVSG